MPSISLVYIFQEMRRFYYENTESIFGAPYKNNLTILSQAWTIPPEMYHHQDNPATFE